MADQQNTPPSPPGPPKPTLKLTPKPGLPPKPGEVTPADPPPGKPKFRVTRSPFAPKIAPAEDGAQTERIIPEGATPKGITPPGVPAPNLPPVPGPAPAAAAPAPAAVRDTCVKVGILLEVLAGNIPSAIQEKETKVATRKAKTKTVEKKLENHKTSAATSNFTVEKN